MSHYRAPPNTGIDMRYVQPYTPKCCADTSKPANLDPRRTSVYRPPVVSRSEPLSASEYLARKKALGNTAVSAPSSLVQYSTGKYAQTIWTTSGACCSDSPKVPAVHPGGYAKPEGLRIEVTDALAARNSTSEWDKVNRDASTTTLQRQGQAIGAQSECCDNGGTTIYPGKGDCCA
jgi:hypothetical protein